MSISAAERMYGFPRAEFIGKTPEFIAAPGKNDMAALPGLVARALAGEPQRFEFWGRRANGEVFPKEVRLVRGNYRDREVVIASADDITERKLAESRLLKAQEMIRSAVAAAHVFPWEWDVATDRLVWAVSPEALLGLPREAGSSYPDFRELVHPDDKPAYLAAGRHTLATGEPYRCEFRLVGTDGPVRWVAARGEAIRGPDGKVARMIGASLDITEQKRLTEEDRTPPRAPGGAGGRAHGRTDGGAGAGRAHGAGQERVPRQHEPRTAHAAQRRAGHGTDRCARQRRAGQP
jgi:PAS domain S-box-containing protein